MGTTRTALATNYGGQFGFSLVIEGYPYILTDAADVSKVVTAYSGTGWSAALAGLRVTGMIKQELRPWSDDMDVPSMTFKIMDVDGNDTFGKAVWKSKPVFKSRLTSAYEPALDGSGTINVQSTTTLPGGTTTVYIGNKAYLVDDNDDTTLTIAAAGSQILAPFAAGSSHHYAQKIPVPSGYNQAYSDTSFVTDVPGKWLGRQVALYIHRIVGGVWDVRAQAQLEFAGKIVDIADSTDGQTVLICHDFRESIKSALVGKEQWKGFIEYKFKLTAGTSIAVTESWFDMPSNDGATHRCYLTVVESGASGPTEIDEGFYQFGEIVSAINAMIQASSLDGEAAVVMVQSAESVRLMLGYNNNDDVDFGYVQMTLGATSTEVMEFLGFDTLKRVRDDGNGRDYIEASGLRLVNDSGGVASTAERPPGRIVVNLGAGFHFDIQHSEGTFINQRDYFPTTLRNYTGDTSGTFGIVEINKNYYYVRFTAGDDTAASIEVLGDANGLVKKFSKPDENLKTTLEDENAVVEVKQVLVIAGTFTDLVTKFLASIDGVGQNHTTYDALPFGAAVPWQLLGDPWLASAKAVEEQSGSAAMMVFTEKPTRLVDILAPEFLIRGCWLLFKDGGYRLVSLETPSAVTPDFVLNEANKAASDGDAQLSTSNVTDEFLRNVVKIDYFKKADGGFLNSLTILDQSSVAEFGERAVTIEARNVYGKSAEIGTSVESLAVAISSKIFPVFAKPLKTLTRTISPNLYHMTPGDTVSLSDNYARSPETGIRSIANRGGIVLSVSHDYGHEGGQLYGEAQILFADEDRTYPLSPACEVDTTYTAGDYVNGYDDMTFRLRIKAHAFSESTAAKDNTHFAAGDKVRVIELDVIDAAASYDLWERVVASVSGDYIELTASLGGWSGSATKRFVIVADEYADVQASQKLFAFQADQGAGMIEEDLALPNVYGEPKLSEFTTYDTEELPSGLAHAHTGDGMPATPVLLQQCALMINNLTNFRGAPHSPVLLKTPAQSNLLSTWETAQILPFYLGGIFPPGYGRRIVLAPFFRTTDAGDPAYVRVTSCRFPPKTSSAFDALDFSGQVRQATWSTTSEDFVQGDPIWLTPIRATLASAHTYLIVEIKGSTLERCYCYGLSTLYLGPLELYTDSEEE